MGSIQISQWSRIYIYIYIYINYIYISGLARFPHPSKYRAVITVLGKTSNSGKYQPTWEKLLKGLKFEPFLQYKLLYHHHNDTCVIIHQYWLFSTIIIVVRLKTTILSLNITFQNIFNGSVTGSPHVLPIHYAISKKQNTSAIYL